MNDDTEIELSDQSQVISSGDSNLSVEIYRIKGTPDWHLEIVDEVGNATVWDDTFISDTTAITVAQKAIAAETAEAFVGPANGKPGETWH